MGIFFLVLDGGFRGGKRRFGKVEFPFAIRLLLLVLLARVVPGSLREKRKNKNKDKNKNKNKKRTFSRSSVSTWDCSSAF